MSVSREKSFVAKGIYEDRSLQETVEDLSDPKITVTEDKIINFVIKYFYGFRFPESISERIKLEDIEYIFNQAHRFFSLHRERKGKIVQLNPGDSLEEFSFFQRYMYSTSMLGDVAATATILKEILRTIFEKEDFNNVYTGLDLGSGSGILTIAGVINAMRSDFSNILSIGCEINKESRAQSIKILSKIFPEKVIIGGFDTTSEIDMSKLLDKKGKRKFTLITNENITTTGVPMGKGPDPFHQNNGIIFDVLAPMIAKETKFFPGKIRMLIDLGETMKKEIEGSKENAFESIRLAEFGEFIKRDIPSLPDDWNIFQHVFPLGIELDGKMVPLHRVGEEFYESGKLKRLFGWRHRWSGRGVGVK